jgi:hypothetical protein
VNAGCEKWFRCFPDASVCTYFEREPGSDDELGGGARHSEASRRQMSQASGAVFDVIAMRRPAHPPANARVHADSGAPP